MINEIALPIKGIEIDRSLDDLHAIGPYLKGCKILGLGEATHGTRDFFALKARIIRYGVEHLGFKIVAFEAPFDLEGLNDYILEGNGELQEKMRELDYWIWQTEEVRDLISWLRRYNEKLPLSERVRFVGIDMQSSKGIRYFQNLWEGGNWEIDPRLKKTIESYQNYHHYDFFNLSTDSLSATLDQINALKAWVRKEEKSLLSQLGVTGYRFCVRHAEVLYETIGWALAKNEGKGFQNTNYRDSCMAANTLWLTQVAFPGEKVLLWAHNGHICRYDKKYELGRVRTMGYFLDRAIGEAYYTVGFDFDRGAFRASDAHGMKRSFSVSDSKKKSLGWYFRFNNHPIFFWSWKDAQAHQSLSKWASKEHHIRTIGAGFYPEKEKWSYRHWVTLPEFFDAMIFVKETAAARPLLSPQLNVNLPLMNLPGKRIRIKTYVKREHDANKSSHSVMNLHCWTQTRTLKRHVADFQWKHDSKQEILLLEGNIPLETEILHLVISNFYQKEIIIDEIRVEVEDEGEWKLLASHSFSFRRDSDLENLVFPEGQVSSRISNPDLLDEWGLKLTVKK